MVRKTWAPGRDEPLGAMRRLHQLAFRNGPLAHIGRRGCVRILAVLDAYLDLPFDVVGRPRLCPGGGGVAVDVVDGHPAARFPRSSWDWRRCPGSACRRP